MLLGYKLHSQQKLSWIKIKVQKKQCMKRH